MTYVKYRGAEVPVAREGTETRHGKKMVKVRTTVALPHRPKGSIDYRSPDKVYSGRPAHPSGMAKKLVKHAHRKH